MDIWGKLGRGALWARRAPWQYRPIALLVLVLAVGLAVRRTGDGTDSRQRASAKAEVVTFAPVTRTDIPIEIDAMSVVEPFETVTLRPQADGQIVSIAVRDGAHVRKGDVLASIDPRMLRAELTAAQAVLARDEAQLVTARLDLERSQRLRERDFVAAQVLEARRAQVAQAVATVDADRAAVDRARVALSYTDIVSPLDGVIGIIRLSVGALVRTGDAAGFIVVNQVQPIAAILTVPAGKLGRLQAALKEHSVTVELFERSPRRRVATGTLAAIDNQIDSTTATVKLKAVFANTDEALWPGQLLDAVIRIGTLPQVLVAPTTAILQGPDGPFAYVVVEGRAVPRRVTVGEEVAGRTVIVSGLDAGMTIVSEGHFKLQPGTPVEAPAAAGGGLR